MHRLSAIALLLAAQGLAADRLQTTWICTDARGAKSIQDRPCPTGTDAQQRDTVIEQPDIGTALRRMQDSSRNAAAVAECRRLRASAQVSERRQAAAICR